MTALISFLTGYIPQGLSFVLFLYAFCKIRVDLKKYAISSFIMIMCIWFVRQILPVSSGIHTLINILVLIGLCYGYIHMPLKRTVIGCLAVSVIMLILELIDVLVLTLIFGSEKVQAMGQDSNLKTYLAIPAMVAFTVLVIVFYLIRTKRKPHGEE